MASVRQLSNLRLLIRPEASDTRYNFAVVWTDGGAVWVLIRRLNYSYRRSIAFVLALRCWLGGGRVKVNSRLLGSMLPAAAQIKETEPRRG